MDCIIVDDEYPAREELKYFIKNFSNIKVVNEFDDSVKALEYIENNKPDIVFLDINMPKLDGVTLSRVLSKREHEIIIVFITAYKEYAVEAFEVEAFDYILKPFSEERILRTLNKLKKREHNKKLEKVNELQNIENLEILEKLSKLEELERLGELGGLEKLEKLNKLDKLGELERLEKFEKLQKLDKSEQLKNLKVATNRITLLKGNKMVVIDVEDICFCEARERETLVYTEEEVYIFNNSISEFYKRLPQDSFFKSHRSYIVNIDKIVEIIPWFNSTYQIKVKNREEVIPVSRNNTSEFKALMGI
ncbi:LytR/AlgR family response regulator transcription factor [Hathewaya massiliensis]|uniref:LytR/AlgR family response regulator transcription factor n=1 Tax=Hathewaya massiliensis TaxID=1964382 RepID=UPI00115BC4AC|nr:response regulator transcription factor [Hathewaya massiliensis]